MKKRKALIFSLLTTVFILEKVSGQSGYTFPETTTLKIGNGINWTKGLTWEEVKAKAKAENKYIFLDCFATWCRPCKAMDKQVYADESVGKQLNENFISVKVQMDKTDYDDEQIKRWYVVAAWMQKTYTISAFPTFLFFSPEGIPIHKDVGFKKTEEFIKVSKNALDPNQQYYAILRNYQPGKLDTTELKALSPTLMHTDKVLAGKMGVEYFSRIPITIWGDKENLNLLRRLAKAPGLENIAYKYLASISPNDFRKSENSFVISSFKSYPIIQELILGYLKGLDNTELRDDIKRENSILIMFKDNAQAKNIATRYIQSLSKEQLFEKEHISLLVSFTKTTKDPGFSFFYINRTKIDEIIKRKDFSKGVISSVIFNEEVKPFLDSASKHGDVPWNRIHKSISNKYSEDLAQGILMEGRVMFYKYKAEKYNTNWKEYIKYYIEKVEKYGTDTTSTFLDAILLNNFVYDAILFHSDQPNEINIGLKWMEGVIRRNPKDANSLDTYANLLNKAGKTKEAIYWMNKAVQMAENNKEEWLLKNLKESLSAMVNGRPKWKK